MVALLSALALMLNLFAADWRDQMAALAGRVFRILAEPESNGGNGESSLELYGVSRLLGRRGERSRARALYERALAAGLPAPADHSARHELARKFLRRKLAAAEKRGDPLDRGGQLAKHGMARQPETRHFAEIRMSVPLLARIAFNENAQVLGPAAAAGKRKGIQIGDFDGHSRLDSRCAPDCEGQTCAT